jgi:hypothetical protein
MKRRHGELFQFAINNRTDTGREHGLVGQNARTYPRIVPLQHGQQRWNQLMEDISQDRNKELFKAWLRRNRR